jgi:hypothetical protein
VGLLAMFALALAPFVAAGVVAWAGYRLWAERRAPGTRSVLLAAVTVSIISLGWLTTPLAGELILWLLD